MAITLLVGTEKGMFILESDNSRREWERRGPYHPGWQVYSVWGRDSELIAGCSSYVYGPHLQRSTDAGKTWEPIEGSPKFPEGSPRRLQQIWSLNRSRAGDQF